MARIKSTCERGEFNFLQLDSMRAGEANDCSVKAVAVACNVEYSVAHAAMKAAGRQDRKGAYPNMIHAAIISLGYKVVSIRQQEIIQQYPGVHKNLKSVTTHHPERFRKVWENMGTTLIYTIGHISAFKDGKLHDWAVGRAKRATWVVQVVKA